MIIVDLQNDFCTGSMAVEEAEQIVPIINDLRQMNQFHYIFRTRDWHPKNHISFQENNPGANLFETVRIKETGVD